MVAHRVELRLWYGVAAAPIFMARMAYENQVKQSGCTPAREHNSRAVVVGVCVCGNQNLRATQYHRS